MNSLDSRKVLLVDDDEFMLASMKNALDDHYQIVSADSGKKALALLEQSDSFAVIVSDMNMPEMDGAEFLSRTQALAKDALRIMLTGDQSRGTPVRAVNDAKVFRFLEKPCSQAELISTIDKAIEEFDQKLAIERERESAKRAKSAFLNTVSDELLTPLNPILGFSSLLKDEVSGENREYVEGIAEAGKELMRKLDTILDYANSEFGGIQVSMTRFRPRVLFEDIYQRYKGVAEKKGLQLEVHVGEKVPETVEADREKLCLIAIQLLENALKFSDTGKVDVNIDWVYSHRQSEDAVLQLVIRDEGRGIDPSLRMKVFESFSQIDQSDSRAERGLGLGLALVQKMVETLGAELECVDNEPKGTCFNLKIPCRN